MESQWTSKKPISGLRHFVLLNKVKEKDQIKYLLVSVIDVDIYLKISYEDLINNGNWEKGWLDLPKSESITKEYHAHKKINERGKNKSKIFINEDSLFNIS